MACRIDRGMLEGIRQHWTNIQDQLIDAIDVGLARF